MMIAIFSLAIFLAFYRKHFEELSQRILNVLYIKLAILNIVNAFLMFTAMLLNISKAKLSSAAVKAFVQIKIFPQLLIFITFLLTVITQS